MTCILTGYLYKNISNKKILNVTFKMFDDLSIAFELLNRGLLKDYAHFSVFNSLSINC